MRKEVSVAILLGFGIGLIVVFGVITAQTALKQYQPSSGESQSGNLTPTPPSEQAAPAGHALKLLDPVEGEVFSDQNTTVIRGETTPQSEVVITTEQEQFIISADAEGKFTQAITLVSGENEIHLVSFSPAGERAELTMSVVYTTADF